MTNALVNTIQNWQAPDWPAFRATWRGLRPWNDDPPRFQGETLDRKQAGYLFERLIPDAFRLDGVTGHYPYRASEREQIDGLVIDGTQGFLIESKYTKVPTGINPVYRLHILVEQRPIGTMGLFFSGWGYTRGARDSADFLKPIRVLLFDRVDLEWAFGKEGRMMTMVRKKWAFALKFGKPDLPIAEFDDSMRARIIPLGFFAEDWEDATPQAQTTHGEPPGTPLPGGSLSG